MKSITTLKSKSLVMTDVQAYNQHISAFNVWASGRPISPELIAFYIDEIKNKYLPASLHKIKSALKAALPETFPQYKNDARFIAALDVAFKRIKIPTIDKKVYHEELITEEETNLIIEECPEWLGHIIRILAFTGLRISELVSIRIKDIYQDKNMMNIKIIGKGRDGGKMRRVFIPAAIIKSILKDFPCKKFLFENKNKKPYCRTFLWREIKKHSRRVLGREITPHSFRHSFITRMIKTKKKSVKAVSLYAGHASTKTTLDMYCHDELLPEDVFE